MRERTALKIWKAVALAALAGCAFLYLAGGRARGATTTASVPRFGFDRRVEDARAVSHESTVGHGNSLSLSKAVDLARSPQARCKALNRLARSREVDDVAVNHIVIYTDEKRMLEVRMCATTALGDTQLDAAIEPLVELIDDSVTAVADAALSSLIQFPERSAREAVIDAARSENEQLRMTALRALALENDPEAVSLIMSALENAHPHQQGQLVHILGSTHDPRAVPVLAELLKSGIPRNQHMALNALSEVGGPRAEALLIATVREQPMLATAAVNALSRVDSEEAVEVLIEGARGDYGSQVAAAAMASLIQHQTPEVTRLMTESLKDGTPNQVSAAAQYFATYGIRSAVPALAAQARRGGPMTWNLVDSLGRIGGDEARSLLEEFAFKEGQMGQAALHTLASMPGGMDVARRVAMTRLDKGDPGDAGPLLQLVSGSNTPEAKAALLRAARSSNPALSTQALHWLSQGNDPECIRLLEEKATSGSSAEQRTVALRSLIQAGHQGGLVALETHLKDPSPDVRANAVNMLTQLNSPEAEAKLLDASRDADQNVANSAASALAQLGSTAAVTRLEEMARAANGAAPQALHALVSVNPERAAAIAEAMASAGDTQARIAAVQVSSMLGHETGRRIVMNAMRSEDSALIREALGHVGAFDLPHSELQSLLAPLLQNKELPEDVAQTASSLLGGG